MGKSQHIRSLVVLAALLTGACGSAVQRLNVADDWNKLRENRPFPAVQGAAAPVMVTILGTPTLQYGIEGEAAYGSVRYPLKPVLNPVQSGTVIDGGGVALADAVQQHVHSVAPGSTVRLEPNPVADSIVVTPRASIANHVEVVLTAKLPDGTEVTGSGTSDSFSIWGHLGWIIPAVAISGLAPALLWIGPVMRAIVRGHQERLFAQATDRAAAAFARELGQRLSTAQAVAPPPAPSVASSATPVTDGAPRPSKPVARGARSPSRHKKRPAQAAAASSLR